MASLNVVADKDTVTYIGEYAARKQIKKDEAAAQLLATGCKRDAALQKDRAKRESSSGGKKGKKASAKKATAKVAKTSAKKAAVKPAAKVAAKKGLGGLKKKAGSKGKNILAGLKNRKKETEPGEPFDSEAGE